MVKKELSIFILFLTIGISLVLATVVISPFTSINVVEDQGYLYNISINWTDTTSEAANITQVNITFPSSFSFITGSEGTDINSTFTFVNTSTILSWYNFSAGLIFSGINRSFQFNLSQATPGQYNISIQTLNVTSNDTYIYLTNLSILVNDTTTPSSIVFAFPTNNTQTNLSLDYITYNISASDNGVISTIRVLLWNNTGLINSSSSVSSAVSYSANFAGLVDGIYYLNASVNDTYGNINWTTTNQTIFVDNLAPAITFSCSPVQIGVRGTITCSCAASDAVSGVLSTSFTENPSTASSGEYTAYCTSSDYAGNVGTSSAVTYIVTSSSYTTGGGGGGSSGSITTEITSSQFTNGYTKSLGTNQQIKFKINNESHYADVQSLATNSVTIEISSIPQIATFNIGEEKKFELTGDRIYDLSVKLNSISVSSSSASITVKSIAEQMPDVQETDTTQEEAETETTSLATSVSWSSVQPWIVVVILVVLAIIIIVYFLAKKKR